MNRSRQAGSFSAGLSDWTRAGKLQPVLHPLHSTNSSNENDLTPGWCVLALCALALGLARGRRLTPWLGVAGVTWVLACGPWVSLGWSEFVLQIGLGAPGNGLSPPWNTNSVATLATQFALGFPLLQMQAIIEMPFSWLAPHLPMLKAFRVPARLAVVVLMCCAPLAALGLHWLFEMTRPARSLAPTVHWFRSRFDHRLRVSDLAFSHQRHRGCPRSTDKSRAIRAATRSLMCRLQPTRASWAGRRCMEKRSSSA